MGHAGRDGHLVHAVAQAAQQGSRCRHLHVPADGVGVDRFPAHRRVGLAQLVQHAGLGGHEHVGRRGGAGGVEHAPGREHPGAAGGQVTLPRLPQRGGRASAFRVDEQLGCGFGRRLAAQRVRADPGVHVAFAEPDVHIGAAGDPPDVGAQELVGQEQHLPVLRDGGHDLRRVGRGTAQVGLRLDLGAGVDVGDDRGAGVLRLPVPDLLRGDGVRQRAARPWFGDQHRPVRGEDLGGLRHEVDAGEHDHARRAPRRPAATGPASRRRDRPRPGSPGPGSCARGSRRRAAPPAAGPPPPIPGPPAVHPPPAGLPAASPLRAGRFPASPAPASLLAASPLQACRLPTSPPRAGLLPADLTASRLRPPGPRLLVPRSWCAPISRRGFQLRV